MSNPSKKIIVVGGVAGGASVAARARRLSEEAHIIVIERGGFVSYANCGLPFHISGEIENRESLLVQTPEGLKNRFEKQPRTMYIYRIELIRIVVEINSSTIVNIQYIIS